MEQENNENRSVLRHAFFGQSGCVTLDHGQNGTFLKVGKKNGNGWGWQAAKLSMPELGDIISVLKGETEKVSFFHSFNGRQTKIWINKDDKSQLWVKIEDHAKPLNQGEQEVLAVLLASIIEQRLKENGNEANAGAREAPAFI